MDKTKMWIETYIESTLTLLGGISSGCERHRLTDEQCPVAIAFTVHSKRPREWLDTAHELLMAIMKQKSGHFFMVQIENTATDIYDICVHVWKKIET
jgi:hypothetical protein